MCPLHRATVVSSGLVVMPLTLTVYIVPVQAGPQRSSGQALDLDSQYLGGGVRRQAVYVEGHEVQVPQDFCPLLMSLAGSARTPLWSVLSSFSLLWGLVCPGA